MSIIMIPLFNLIFFVQFNFFFIIKKGYLLKFNFQLKGIFVYIF